MKCGVVVFPGSNCDHDVYHVLKHVTGQETEFLWHRSTDLAGCDLVVLPGGFAYGDYLRAGALAALSPIMEAVREHARRGGLVLGICNGFQVLLEAGLLPGAMRRNRSLRFLCQDVLLRVERSDLPFTRRYEAGQIVRAPIAHAEGCYTDSEAALDALEAAGRVVFRYVDERGERTEAANPNGSSRSIAGICNQGGNVLGMMPHPERCAEEILGTRDGAGLFASLVAFSADVAAAVPAHTDLPSPLGKRAGNGAPPGRGRAGLSGNGRGRA
ncbi:MAG TPA: phosphoribosylformylglycinamidine synthase subunit PurQ [Thermoanaerobaculia bacterium]|nr:phosphoribosylformylglycinamidine synthase subunit PurQ [Thermoanaerobaculia bacterium]